MNNQSSVKEELARVSNDLNLSFESQDWGIINSDYKRVFEFIDYFNNNSHSKEMKYWLTELIVASVNDAILADKNFLGQYNNLKNFLLENKNLDQSVVSYWSSLAGVPNADEFPVAQWLRT